MKGAILTHQDTGVIVVKRLVIAHDCGPISNPNGLRNQIEGAALQDEFLRSDLRGEIYRSVRRIAHRETGLYSMEPNISLLLSALYAGSVEGSIISGLVRRAQQVQDIAGLDPVEEPGQRLTAAPGVLGEYDVNRELDELTMLLKWYVRRKMSLAGLEVDQLSRGIPTDGFVDVAFDEEIECPVQI